MRNLAYAGLVELALETAAVLLEIDPDNDVAHAADLAVTLAEQDCGDDAVRLMRERVDARPHDAQTWAGLVEIYRTLGDDERAQEALSRAIAVAGEFGEFGDVGDLLARFDNDSW